MVRVGILAFNELASELAGGAPAWGVVDARSRDEYECGHLPRAVWMGWEDWCGAPPAHTGLVQAQPGYWGRLAEQSAAWYGERLAEHGLSQDRPVVVYADGVRSKGREGRIAWMLLYLGAQRVYLLDGGWGAWLQHGGAVEREQRRLERGRFAIHHQEERRVRFETLKHGFQAGELPLFVDTRCQSEFEGREYGYMPRMGRLPGAALLPFASLFAATGHYVGRERYLAGLPETIRVAGRLVTYCEVGVRASTAALLHEIYTGQVVEVFDGSLMEWSLDPELPVHSG